MIPSKIEETQKKKAVATVTAKAKPIPQIYR